MKALIVVDVQNDFCPGGSLAVTDGDKIVPVINKILGGYDLVIFTADWHPADMECFVDQNPGKNILDKFTTSKGVEDIIWPAHCVQNTVGAEFNKDIKFENIKGDIYIFKKGLDKDEHPYSGFGAEGLMEFLVEKGVDEVHVCGLATDYCVKDTVLDAVEAEFKVAVILDAVRGIDEKTVNEAMEEFYNNGVFLTNSWELPLFKLM